MKKTTEFVTMTLIRAEIFLRDRKEYWAANAERGAEGVETGLIIAGVAAVILIVLAIFRNALIALWERAVAAFS